MNEPHRSFTTHLRSASSNYVQDLPKIEGRPGAGMSPANLEALEASLKEKHGQYLINYRDVLSAALYPQVFDEFK